MTPLYGFVEGDTLGLLVLASDTDTVGDVASKLRSAARLRAVVPDPIEVVVRERVIEPHFTLAQAGIAALDRIDVRRRSDRP